MKKEDIHPYCIKCLKEHKGNWYLKNGKVWCKDPSGIEDLQICSLIKNKMNVTRKMEEVLEQNEIDFANFLFDPVKWSNVEMSWDARWYQTWMLQCSASRKVSRIGRRAGKTEAICIKMLHYAYTHENVIVLVVAPYKNQVGLIFDKLDMFLSRGESLIASIKRNVKNPYRLELHNGSRIMGFTSGTRTGSKSTGIRGQDAHAIFIDEADFLSENDFEVILAIQASRPDVEIWASSTPTGKRDMFWRFCTEIDLGFKEFHFSSSVSPTWTRQTERLERAQYSEQGYAHEFDADFGDEAEGVFLDKFIDEAIENYNISKLGRNGASLYTIGVDWNTAGTGTCIVVTEWNSNLKGGRGAFRVARKEIIGSIEFTQVKACEEIIKLNAQWNPAFIYVDQGYGHCVVPDTSILTNRGSKKICDMVPGDLVLSEDGNWHPVQDVTERRVDENIYHVKPKKGLELKITKEHPLLVYDGNKTKWLKPDQLNKYKHKIAIPRMRQINKDFVYDIKEHVKGLEGKNEKIWFRTGYSSLTGKLVKVNRYINGLDKSFLRIVGWYIAEGSIGRNYQNVEFSLNGIKEQQIAKQIQNDIKNVFGVDSRIDQRDETRLRVLCSSSVVSRFLVSIAGRGANNKYINKDFLSHSYKIGELIRASILGDGYIDYKKQEIQYSTISKSLRDTMIQWFINIGILPSVYIDDRKGKHIKSDSVVDRNCNFKTGYSIRFTGSTDKLNIIKDLLTIDLNCKKNKIDRNNYIVSGNFIFVPIANICTKHYSGIVNDLGIKNVHSFVGNGVLLHNTQIEMLRKYGLEHPKTGLVNKLKGIYFGDMMEIRDPVTRQRVKKHMKPFMVNLAARRLEDGQVILPVSEDVKNGLIGQMRDYTVIRKTALGQPIYSDNNDHTLVAWMLSILAATIEFSDMAKQNRAVNIGLTGSFGEKQDKDLKINRGLSEGDKRKTAAVTPRWFPPRIFKETTLKNNLDFLTRKRRLKKQAQQINRSPGLRKKITKSRASF